MTKFTPGPWRATLGTLVRVMQGGVCIAGVHRIGVQTSKVTPGEVEANAHLIAAAPELYHVLDAAIIALRNRDQSEHEAKIIEAGKIALAKAEGRL